MSALDEIDGESAEARAQRLHGEYRSDPAGYVRKLAQDIDTSRRDAQRTNLREQRDRLVRLYHDDPTFHAYILNMGATRPSAEPTEVIYDLLRSGFAPLVLAMGAATADAQQRLVEALKVQRIEMVIPADYVKSERAPEWMRQLITDAKNDMEAQKE